MGTGAERELLMNCKEPLEGSFCHNPLVIIKAKAIHSCSNIIEIKSTMTLHASWNALFNSLTMVNESGN
jgi:hypothetical protein